MENGWEKEQEWMLSDRLKDSWKWEGGGLVNQGDIGGNTKKWTDLENQQNLITVFYGMWKKEI